MLAIMSNSENYGGARAGSGRKNINGESCVMRVPKRFKSEIKAYIKTLLDSENSEPVIKTTDKDDQIEIAEIPKFKTKNLKWVEFKKVSQIITGRYIRHSEYHRYDCQTHEIIGRSEKMILLADGTELSISNAKKSYEIGFEIVT
jgi:hypothetical protein